MKWLLALTMLAGLAACGVDGEPIRPTGKVGVTITPDGVRSSTTVVVTAGRVSVGVSG